MAAKKQPEKEVKDQPGISAARKYGDALGDLHVRLLDIGEILVPGQGEKIARPLALAIGNLVEARCEMKIEELFFAGTPEETATEDANTKKAGK